MPARSLLPTDWLRTRVDQIVADSNGYIWIATSGGFSWFNGSRMKTYGGEDALPYRFVPSILETPTVMDFRGTTARPALVSQLFSALSVLLAFKDKNIGLRVGTLAGLAKVQFYKFQNG